jgi:hypothetical protein
VRAANTVTELVEALEIIQQAGHTEVQVSRILTRWQREMESMGVPTRAYLMIQLLKMKMDDLYDRYTSNGWIS